MSRLSLLGLPAAALLLVTTIGCGETDAPEAGEQAAGEQAPADGAAAEQAEAPAAEAKTAAGKLQGEWAIQLSDKEKRQVEVLKMALKDPAPTEEEMKAEGLTDDEKMMVALMAAAKAENPDDPKVAEMQQAAESLAEATVTFTDKDMTFQAGPMSEKASYTVKSETETTVTIEATSSKGEVETSVVTFKDDETIELASADNPEKKQVFVRK